MTYFFYALLFILMLALRIIIPDKLRWGAILVMLVFYGILKGMKLMGWI